MKSLFRAGGTAFVVALAAGVALVPLARSDNYGNFPTGSAGLKPDGSSHSFCFYANFSSNNAKDGANHAMDNLEAQTTMTKNKMSDCSNATDAKFHTAQLGGLDNQWICVNRSGSYCLEARLDFDQGNITSLDDWKQGACHEVGHSVGLAHGEGNDCMGTQHDDPDERRYTDHHRDHINQDRF